MLLDTVFPPIARGATAGTAGKPGRVPKVAAGDHQKVLRGDMTMAQMALNYIGGSAGNAVPATATTAGDYYLITAAGTSQGKTWAVGEIAVYEGTSGNWTQLAGVTVMVKVAMPTATADAGSVGQYAIDADRRAEYVAGTGWVFFDGYQV